jgi:hypothetical protein
VPQRQAPELARIERTQNLLQLVAAFLVEACLFGRPGGGHHQQVAGGRRQALPGPGAARTIDGEVARQTVEQGSIRHTHALCPPDFAKAQESLLHDVGRVFGVVDDSISVSA